MTKYISVNHLQLLNKPIEEQICWIWKFWNHHSTDRDSGSVNKNTPKRSSVLVKMCFFSLQIHVPLKPFKLVMFKNTNKIRSTRDWLFQLFIQFLYNYTPLNFIYFLKIYLFIYLTRSSTLQQLMLVYRN